MNDIFLGRSVDQSLCCFQSSTLVFLVLRFEEALDGRSHFGLVGTIPTIVSFVLTNSFLCMKMMRQSNLLLFALKNSSAEYRKRTGFVNGK